MKAEDLRIGNIIEVRDGNVVIVKALDFDALYEYPPVYYIHGGHELDHCRPIPISLDWLSQFGFKQTLNYWEKNRFKLVILEDRIFYRDDYLQTEIVHVHELQNLYYCLTKSELDFKKLN